MQLTAKHIEELYSFTKTHYVEWYDLQTELVDHLANDIEQIWLENPGLSFHQARDKAFGKFGIFGFSDLIEKKQNALTKKYWKLVWQIFKSYFKIPKIIMTLVFILGIYTIFHIVKFKDIILYTFLAFFIGIPLIFIFKNYRKMSRRQKITSKKWMFEQTTASLGGFFLVINLPLQLLSFVDKIEWTNINQIIFSVVAVLSCIFIFILVQIVPFEMRETMSRQYPEYKLYNKA
jgi:hypothetical protein